MQISDLKSLLDIIEVARSLGIQVDPKTNKALCPFHNDEKPSLQFSKEKQICTCFSGSCTAGTMDVVDLVKKYKKVETKEAIA
jgi:DNA primase